MPHVTPEEALNQAFADLRAVGRGAGLARVALVGTPSVRVVLLRWPAGHSTVPHRHPGAEELFLVLEGAARFTIGTGSPRLVGPGELVLAARDEPHAIYVPGDGDGVVLLAAVAPNEDVADETIELVGSYGEVDR